MTDWQKLTSMHRSPLGTTHSGPKEDCVSAQCGPDKFSRYVAADEEQNRELAEHVAPWIRGAMARQRYGYVAQLIDAIDADDPEAAHGRLDELLLSIAPDDVWEAAKRLMSRCDWWAGA